MIKGNINNIKAYKGISERIDRAIDFLLDFDKETPCGRYEIDSDNIYANVICTTTTAIEDFKFEAHKKYLDLQYIVKGEEIMIHAFTEDCKITKEYDEKDDYCLLEGEGDEVLVKEGEFYLVHPFDAHAPAKSHTPSEIKKVIVKIKL